MRISISPTICVTALPFGKISGVITALHLTGRVLMIEDRMPSQPAKKLETFPNPHPDREYTIDIESPEFTALCPKTGQPDFANIKLQYVPAEKCVELKSYKLYLWSFRDEGCFHEDVTNRILNDLVSVLEPVRCKVVGDFNVRGGIKTVITVEYDRDKPKK